MKTLMPALICCLTILITIQGCTTSAEDEPDDLLLNGPFLYNMQGEIEKEITGDLFELRTEWTKLETETLNESQALLHASVRDTIDGIDTWQRYFITFVKYDNWPESGEYSIADISDVRDGLSDDFFINLRSMYREESVPGNDIERVYLEDYAFHVSGGTVNITTSNSTALRGSFNLNFDLSEKRTWDTIDEVIEGPVENALTVQGAFDIDLTNNRVDLLSQW
jgi:hypothetical protein